jgi:putative transposase
MSTANAYLESWIATVKRECFGYFAYFTLRHADHITQTFAEFYNNDRTHQSLGNRPLESAGKPQLHFAQAPVNPQQVGYRSELGGLLKQYYRQAA